MHNDDHDKNFNYFLISRMLQYNTPEALWAEAINITCYASNHLFLHKFLGKTPYELFNGKKPDVSCILPGVW